MIHDFRVKKHGESESELKFPMMYHLYFTYASHQSLQRPPQIQNSQKCLPDSDSPHFFNQESCIICIWHTQFTLGRKTQERPPKLEISRKTSQIRILLIFLPRSHISLVFGIYNSLQFEKPRKDPQKVEIPRKTSQIRIPCGRFRGCQSRNHGNQDFHFL